MTTSEFINRLKMAKPTGSGWIAKCPAHDDRTPSLSIMKGDDGRTLLKCHAGCSTAEIVTALGLQMRDLFVQHQLKPVVRRHRKPCL